MAASALIPTSASQGFATPKELAPVWAELPERLAPITSSAIKAWHVDRTTYGRSTRYACPCLMLARNARQISIASRGTSVGSSTKAKAVFAWRSTLRRTSRPSLGQGQVSGGDEGRRAHPRVILCFRNCIQKISGCRGVYHNRQGLRSCRR